MKITELDDLINEFVRSKPLRPNSRRAYLTDLFFFKQFYAAENFSSSSSLEELTKQKMLAWLSQYPARAANRRGINIRRFLLWLQDSKKIKINPEFYLPWQFQDPIPQNPDRPAELSEEELQKLLNFPSLSLNKRAILSLLIHTGASLEELAALTWNDVSLGKLAHITIGEAGKSRVVPLEKETAELISKLKESQIHLLQAEENPKVFRQEREMEPLSGAYMAIIIRRATLKALGREISPTQLHEFSKKRMIENFSLDIVLDRLGKKKAVSLVRIDEDKIDLERLKKIHQKAFEKA